MKLLKTQIQNSKILWCLGNVYDILRRVKSNSVAMVLIDPPYGNKLGKALGSGDLDFEFLWKQFERVLVDDHCCVAIFCQQPFTSKVVFSNEAKLRHHWIWDKVQPSGMQLSKYKPMVRHEEIVAFSKSTINYFPLMVKNEHSSPKRIVNVTSISSHISKARKTKADVAGTFYTHHYPQSILAFGKNKGESRNYRHPTRKPVSLLRYIIETYTKQNDTVLDCFAGIASTGAACVETNRHFIGIEIDEDYWKIGRNRLLDYEKADDSQP